jgi:hypothetical protein
MKQAKAEQADFMSKAQLDAYDTYVYGKTKIYHHRYSRRII